MLDYIRCVGVYFSVKLNENKDIYEAEFSNLGIKNIFIEILFKTVYFYIINLLEIK